MGAGQRVPRPFAYRWLLPLLCGQSLQRWQFANAAGLVLLGVGTAALAGFGWAGVVAALIVVTLPMSLFNARHPVLADSLALGLAVCAAAVAQVSVPLAVLLAVVAGTVKEPAPVFAAVFAWQPWLLLALIGPLLRIVLCRPGRDVVDYVGRADSLEHPFRTGWLWHSPKLRDLNPILVWPWGGALIGLAAFDLRMGVALLLAYGQMAVATDSVRLYQWAGPVLAVAAVSVVPSSWWLLLLAACVFNPFRGDEV